MCGIAGIVDFNGSAPTRETIGRMTDLLRHRGPDDEGIEIIGPAGLGHRRLSIIDLSPAGHQPMTLEGAGLHVVFNGEIYNFQEVKAELEALGETFRTRSDTEVILRAYRAWGVDSLQKLNGMFAFALWDEQRQTLFAARDRLGKKPFFYHHRPGRIAFGSEMKALLADPTIERDVDPAAIDEYLTYSYIPAPRTVFRGIRKLLPGHYLLFQKDRITTAPYWELTFGSNGSAKSEPEALERLEELFRASVRRRLVSDVPVGAFLSGGLDSSAVVGMMAELMTEPVRTYTIGFTEEGFSEIEDARVVARHFGTRHHEYSVRADAVEILPDLVWHLDEPFGDSSAVPSYYVAKLAAQDVKVVLSGDGGDELFAGYTRYQEALAPKPWRWIPHSVRKTVFGSVAANLPIDWPGRNRLYEMGNMRRDSSPDWMGLYPYIRERIYSRAMRAELNESRRSGGGSATALEDLPRLRNLDRLSRLQYLDTMRYLPDDILVKVDRTTMAHSLESRAPLLDHELVSYVATLPPSFKLKDGVSKYLFRKMISRYLPSGILEKKKQGFAIPRETWFRSDLKAHARERLLDPKAIGRGYFDPRILDQVLTYHAAGQRDYSGWIWCLLVLEEWHRAYVDPATRRI
jgi:asparagine synthase (glutamine-hydrolysing)